MTYGAPLVDGTGITGTMIDVARGRSEKVPCRLGQPRRCPMEYDGPCGDRQCPRFVSDSEDPWRQEWPAGADEDGCE